jgi:hypothetical protein
LEFAFCPALASHSNIFLSPYTRLVIFVDNSMQTETLQENQSLAPGDAPKENVRRGFSSMEKWVIWAVFCLLVGLSTHLLVFPGLLFISWSVVRFRWYVSEGFGWRRRWPALMVFLAGLGLIFWAAR